MNPTARGILRCAISGALTGMFCFLRGYRVGHADGVSFAFGEPEPDPPGRAEPQPAEESAA